MQWNGERYGGFSAAEPWLSMGAGFRKEITVEAAERGSAGQRADEERARNRGAVGGPGEPVPKTYSRRMRELSVRRMEA